MTDFPRTAIDFRFEQNGTQFILTLTTSIGAETVVEHVPLGNVDLDSLIESLESVVKSLCQQRQRNLISAA